MSTSGGTPAGELSVVTAHLTGADLATLFSVPVEIIPAPGANKAIIILGVAYETVAGVTSYEGQVAGLYYAGTVTANQNIAATLDDLDLFALTVPASQVYPAPPNPGSIFDTADATNAAVVVTEMAQDPVRAGAIVTTTLQAAGTGYVAGDTGTVNGKNYGAAATYVVDAVGALGIVTAFHVVSAGTGYDTVSNPHATTNAGAQPGVGVGFTLNVTAIPAADGDLYVTAFYKTITTH